MGVIFCTSYVKVFQNDLNFLNIIDFQPGKTEL